MQRNTLLALFMSIFVMTVNRMLPRITTVTKNMPRSKTATDKNSFIKKMSKYNTTNIKYELLIIKFIYSNVKLLWKLIPGLLLLTKTKILKY